MAMIRALCPCEERSDDAVATKLRTGHADRFVGFAASQ
jgi:hypothetical protein